MRRVEKIRVDPGTVVGDLQVACRRRHGPSRAAATPHPASSRRRSPRSPSASPRRWTPRRGRRTAPRHGRRRRGESAVCSGPCRASTPARCASRSCSSADVGDWSAPDRQRGVSVGRAASAGRRSDVDEPTRLCRRVCTRPRRVGHRRVRPTARPLGCLRTSSSVSPPGRRPRSSPHGPNRIPKSTNRSGPRPTSAAVACCGSRPVSGVPGVAHIVAIIPPT